MTHNEKIIKMLEELPKLGISRSYIAPPLYKILWKMGFEIAPPLFASFGSLFLLQGGFFAIGWGVLMWLLIWRTQEIHVLFIILAPLLAGVLFGVIMALIIRRKAKKKNLPLWKDYR